MLSDETINEMDEKDIDPAIMAMHKLKPGESCELWQGKVFRVLFGWIYRDDAAGITYVPDDAMKMINPMKLLMQEAGLKEAVERMKTGRSSCKKPDKYAGEGFN